MTLRCRAVLPALLLLAAGLSGCAGSAEPPEAGAAREEAASPAASATADLGPLEELPRDSVLAEADGFALAAPASWQRSTRPGPGGIPMLVLGTPSEQAGGVVEVVAFREEEPPAGVQDQMAVLAASKADLGGVTDLRRESLAWPGSTEAVLLRWSEPTSTADGRIVQRFAQLAAQEEDGSIVTVVAVAPEAEFEEAGALEVLRSLRLGAGA